MTKLQHYTVTADAATGEWLGDPCHVGEVDKAEWSARQDTEDRHFDTYEHFADKADSMNSETRAIEVVWQK